jgi:hypothetical protein
LSQPKFYRSLDNSSTLSKSIYSTSKRFTQVMLSVIFIVTESRGDDDGDVEANWR